MGIVESDLPYLPFTRVYWYCMVPGCSCRIIVRDYGIGPLYYWPCKVLRKPNGGWRGGWSDYMHGYICGKHYAEYKRDQRAFVKTHTRNEQYMASRIIPLKKSCKST